MESDKFYNKFLIYTFVNKLFKDIKSKIKYKKGYISLFVFIAVV